ncbi:MAG: hypothetical protein EOO50_12200 [Flavobacterium sp.]|uniref:carboxypeptidase-like regulatory domain-containing protein n=1 Tax=Flavobacterium sp. TaxID=239 RepID=UPI001227AF2B|nr:carboxypeptidase-like regulatory domain-containing protein [Flavobacterium sp.]RZJ65875.1 MAG: hypothetical protein EOO50_12200 [Flavobacterium sp.]
MKMQINIPTPCHEDWQQMTHVEKGRFCGSCQKTVYDFTHSSDAEIIAKLKTSTDACGRFQHSQLQRELYVPEKKSPLWLAAASGVLGFMIIGGNESYSQVKQGEVIQTDIQPQIDIRGKIAITQTPVVSGKVVDSSGVALPGVNIYLKDDIQRQTTSDLNGNFIIDAQFSELLRFSFIGFDEKELSASDVISQKTITLTERYYTVGIIVSAKKPNIFKRAYYKVRNWFR